MQQQSRVPTAQNEPVLDYAPGSPERAELAAQLKAEQGHRADVPMFIGGEEVRTGTIAPVVCPHDHHRVIAEAHQGTAADVERAIAAARTAKPEWRRLPYEARASVFLKAADLLAGPWRARLNAATMLGQSKTAHQAEIDAACELIDFWRFNAQFGAELAEAQPLSGPGVYNRSELRPLDGFVFAITPFNFTAIAGNLPSAPALMGNTVVWKPAPTQMRAAHETMCLLREAGLPDGVINLVAGDAESIGQAALSAPDLGGVHFTGSTRTFQHIWRTVGTNIEGYRQYPRIVGETGGKDFIFAHPSADEKALVTAIVRGAFEFQGQKCSAASRVYVPKPLWARIRPALLDTVKSLSVGDVEDFRNFMGAVIDHRAFEKIDGYIRLAQTDSHCEVLAGGPGDKTKGYFVPPTVVTTDDPTHRLMREEIFGPVVTIFPYEEAALDDALASCATTNDYALTGAVFARDRGAIQRLSDALVDAAGNFYINDKPTGAVVGQQPFGGSRASGTNDKAGSAWNLMRWVSPRTVKETFCPPIHPRYPYMD